MPYTLDGEGINTGVESFHTVKPWMKLGCNQFLRAELVCVLEEHSSIGGLYVR